MISRDQFFTALTADARQWADHTDHYTYGPTRCMLHVPPCLADNAPRPQFQVVYSSERAV